jgi:hypothetical protein
LTGIELLGTFAAIEFKSFKETLLIPTFLEAPAISLAFESKVELPGR